MGQVLDSNINNKNTKTCLKRPQIDSKTDVENISKNYTQKAAQHNQKNLPKSFQNRAPPEPPLSPQTTPKPPQTPPDPCQDPPDPPRPPSRPPSGSILASILANFLFQNYAQE